MKEKQKHVSHRTGVGGCLRNVHFRNYKVPLGAFQAYFITCIFFIVGRPEWHPNWSTWFGGDKAFDTGFDGELYLWSPDIMLTRWTSCTCVASACAMGARVYERNDTWTACLRNSRYPWVLQVIFRITRNSQWKTCPKWDDARSAKKMQ